MYRQTPAALRRPLLAAAALAFACAAFAGGPGDGARPPGVPTDRLIVKYRDVASLARAAAASPVRADRLEVLQSLAQRHGLRLAHLRNDAAGAHVLKLDRRLGALDAQTLASQIQAEDASVEYAEPDRILQPMLMPNDAQFSSQWDLYDATGGIRAPQAWDLSTGAGVTVAVLDTGYRPHADLAANIVAGYDFINDTAVANDGSRRDADPRDPGDWITAAEAEQAGGIFEGCPVSDSTWHGTHVAGTIAALTNNTTGVAGVAFGAKVQPARVLGKCGGYTSDIADAIVWASGGSVSGVPANATPARVINLSLGGRGACDITTQNAINSARTRNTVIVVSAGNSNADASGYSPASCSGIVTVAATDRNGARAYYSNFGSAVALAAPGGDLRASAANGILSTLNTGSTTPGSDTYAHYQGTSMAAPHVAGVAALMIAKKPSATVDEVIGALKASARAFPGSCSGCGSGLLDAQAAVLAISRASGGNGSETEPNNSLGAANLQAAPVSIAANIGSRSDQDWFAVDLLPGRTLAATLAPNAASDYDLYVYNSAGQLIAYSERGTGTADAVSIANTGSQPSRRYVRVTYYSGGTGAVAGRYTLSLQW